MAILVLDLDETFWTINNNQLSVHPAQKLGESFSVPVINERVDISIINPEDITTQLFNREQYEAIIILTAGGWDQRAVHIATDKLKQEFSLSDYAEWKLKTALICSPFTELSLYVDDNVYKECGEQYLNFLISELQYKPKNERLQKIIDYNGLIHTEFVVLDNNLDLPQVR